METFYLQVFYELALRLGLPNRLFVAVLYASFVYCFSTFVSAVNSFVCMAKKEGYAIVLGSFLDSFLYLRLEVERTQC